MNELHTKAAILKSGKKACSCAHHILSCPLAERRVYGACSLAGCDHSPDHPVCVTGHPGGVFPRNNSTEEAAVRGYVQSQLAGGSWSQTGDG